MEVERDTETPTTVQGDLVTALEQATLMAKHLSATTDPSQLLQILTSLHSAHHRLTLFLSHHTTPPPTQPTRLPTPAPENSVSSAVGGGGEENDDETGGGEPMLMEDGEDDHESMATTTNAAATVEKVAGRMRECFIQNKRPKRPLSPSAVVAEQLRSYENEAVRSGVAAAAAGVEEFDPLGTKLRSLDLIYQFHA